MHTVDMLNYTKKFFFFLTLVYCTSNAYAFQNRESIQGKLEYILTEVLSEPQATVFIDDSDRVIITNLSQITRFREAIRNYVKRYPQLRTIIFKNDQPLRRKAVVFPSVGLFRPIIFNPFEVSSFAYLEQTNDMNLPKIAANYSLGLRVPIVRVLDLFQTGAALQIELEASNMGIVSTKMRAYSYIVALPIIYAYKNWELRLRPLHYCGHASESLIHELQAKQQLKPKTLAWESVDLTLSYNYAEFFRCYVGCGRVIRRENQNKFTSLVGLDTDFGWYYSSRLKQFKNFFISVNMDFWPWLEYRPSVNAALGIKYATIPNIGTQCLFAVRYHKGYGEGAFKFYQVETASIGFQVIY